MPFRGGAGRSGSREFCRGSLVRACRAALGGQPGRLSPHKTLVFGVVPGQGGGGAILLK
jgi:hypothetical protein